MADKKGKKYLIDNPTLMAEWNWKKNNELGLNPKTLTLGSHQKVWWKCEKGHEWPAEVKSRNNGNGCTYCSGRKAIKGINDLTTINPALASEWNYEKNEELKPEEFTTSSGKKVWWKCDKGDEWQSTINSRNSGNGCPYCSGRYAVKGESDLATVNPQLASEWNYEKNGCLRLEDFKASSGKKVWWKCSKGHEWQARIADRNNGKGCPYCSGRYATKGESDLATANPKLASEWNYERNGCLRLEDFKASSGKKVWWKCEKGHEWQARISHRNKGVGCPICVNKKVIQGYNDLATINPKLASEWNYEKNGDLILEDFTAGSNIKVWWKCEKGHEWQAIINNRNKGVGCPICNSERRTSFPEYAILFYLKKYGEKATHTYKEPGYELDIYIPSMKIAIEYDGEFYHKNKTKKDLEKNSKCKNDGIVLYRIREGLPSLNDSSIDYIVDKNQKNLGEVIQKVLSKIIGINVDVDLQRDAIEIENLREYSEKSNSLLYTNPELAKEWNYEKNGNLKPEHISANSGKKVWWKCKKGHEWQATIDKRNKGTACPYCSNQKVLQGYNDLVTINPKLANEWSCEKNGDLKPEEFTSSSGKKVWWKCEKGHEWQSSINNRNKNVGCPYCSGRYAIKGVSDLATINPKLVKEWNFDRNEDLKPEDFMANSGRKVWWKCSNGHEWQATIASRNSGNGCPFCYNEKRKKKN